MQPFESPIEEAFYWQAIKYLDLYSSPPLTLKSQVQARTTWGSFRVDFVCHTSKRSVGFECDGKDYHEDFHDEFRDALILGEGHCDVMYHLRGADLHYLVDDVLFLISLWDPEIFSQRGRLVLAHKASKELRDLEFDTRSELFFCDVNYGSPPEDGNIALRVRRRSRVITKGRRAHWKSLFRYACRFPNLSFDQLVQQRLMEQVKVARLP